jgi:hypothetical protein
VGDVRGEVVRGNPGGQGGTGSRTETSVRGEIVGSGGRPSGGGGGLPPGEAGGGGDPAGPQRVEKEVRGVVLGSGTGTAPGGTVANDFTRNYFFAQGVLQGTADAGQQLGGRLGQLMIASYYLIKLDPVSAQAWLGLTPGQSITIQDLQNDLADFADVIYGDPQGTDLQHSYESGRTVGKKLTDLFIGKYLPELEVPPLQPPRAVGSGPVNGVPPR